MEMSTVNETGVAEVKIEACDRLLAHRIENKIKTKKVNEVMNRLTVKTRPDTRRKMRSRCTDSNFGQKWHFCMVSTRV